MTRGPLDNRLDRVEGQKIAAAAEDGAPAIRTALRAKAAMGAMIRSAMACAVVDAADAPASLLPRTPQHRPRQSLHGGNAG